MEILERGPNTRKALLSILAKLPAGINAMYELALDRIAAASDYDFALTQRALLWMAHVRERIAIEDLQHALAVSHEDQTYDRSNLVPVDLILAVCGGLIEIRKSQVL